MGIGIIESMDLCGIKNSAGERLMNKISTIAEKVTDVESKINDKPIFLSTVLQNPIKNNHSGNIFFEYASQNHKDIDAWLASENKCTDGSDDGKIGFFSKVGNFFEGIAKTFIGGTKKFLSDPKKVVKTAAVGAGLFVLSCFPPVGTAIAATIGLIGGVKLVSNGLKTIISGVKNAESAETDAEAKDAWEQIGNGTFKTGLGTVAVVKCGSKLCDCYNMPSNIACESVEISKEKVIEAAAKAVLKPKNTVKD